MTARKDASEKPTAKRRLGRGLGSLINAPVPIEAVPPTHDTPTDTRPRSDGREVVSSIEIARIRPSPYQPRQSFDEEALEALGASIRAAGIMQPVVVRPDGNGFQLVIGERRWRAAQRVGLDRIPAVVRDLDDRAVSEWALVENIQREDLNPIERSEAFQRLVNDFDLSHQDLADRVGLSRSSVTNVLRLNDLDDMTKDAVRKGRLTLGHAKALLSISNLELRRRLAELAVRQAWSVRALERRATAEMGATSIPTGAPRPQPPRQAIQTAALAREISEQLGTKAIVQPGRTKGSGRLVLEFYSLDQFDGLLQRMGVKIT